MITPSIRLGLAVLALLLLSVSALGEEKTPDDAEVVAAVVSIQEKYRALPDRRAAQAKSLEIVRESLQGLDLSQLTGPQVSMLAPHLQSHRDPDQIKQYRLSLQRVSQETSVYGAIALVEQIMIGGGDGDALLAAFLDHPGMPRAMNTRHLRTSILRILSGLTPDAMSAHITKVSRALLAIEPAGVTEPLSRATVARMLRVLDEPSVATRLSTHRRVIHAHLLRVARAALAGFSPGFTDLRHEARRIEKCADLVAYLEGPAGRSRLVGQAAPELLFRWSSGPHSPIQKLSDLKGKVVVLDFWTTWCGACVATFPSLGKLQAHYADSHVVVIGVTSVQGYHVPGPGRDPIELEGQPEREFELMAEFARERDVTWNLAFSSRPVMDPRFDVYGLPHVTIIDARGVVRHNKLHPSMPLAKKTELIDALLREAGLDSRR